MQVISDGQTGRILFICDCFNNMALEPALGQSEMRIKCGSCGVDWILVKGGWHAVRAVPYVPKYNGVNNKKEVKAVKNDET